jgi:predicted RNA binding protein YcfA (HicA-like mRNA interferase family)
VAEAIILCSGAEAVRKFTRTGWSVIRQKGSHVMMTRPGYQYTLSIPQHRELGPGLLRKLLKQADVTVEEFNAL